MRILPASKPESLKEAAGLLAAGEVVAIPTETVYGLAARAFDARAVARVFEAKGRPFFDPLIVHAADLAGLAAVADIRDPRVALLAGRFWPGPLTLILPKMAAVPDLVTSGLPTVAVRVPDHPDTLTLLRLTGPLAAPSANLFGRTSPTTALHVADQLDKRIPLILDGGPCRVGVESTILSLDSDPAVLLRPGGTAREDLEALLGPLGIAVPAPNPVAPGQLESHYATRTPLRLCAPGDTRDVPAGSRAGLLRFKGGKDGRGLFEAVEVLSATGDLREAAAALFAALRRLDDLNLDLILAETLPLDGLGLAIMDRLTRAAHPAPKEPA